MLTYSNTASLLGKLVALMVNGLGDTMMKILQSFVSQKKSPGNFQSLNTWLRHVISLIPFVLHKILPVVQKQHSVSASTTTTVQSAYTHVVISNTFVNSAVNSTQGSNVADQTKARLVRDQQWQQQDSLKCCYKNYKVMTLLYFNFWYKGSKMALSLAALSSIHFLLSITIYLSGKTQL